MDNYPIATSFLNKSYKSNKKLQVLMPQFEKALEANQKVRQDLEAIRPELKKHLFNASMYDQAATVSESERDFAKKAFQSLEACYNKIAHMEHLMNKVELGNILSYAVRCKEDETVCEFTSLKTAFQEEAKQLDMLESRSEVKHLRQLQSLLGENQQELLVLEREMENVDRQRENNMKKASDYRNKKIINILETRKLIERLEKKSFAPVASQSLLDADDLMRRKRPSMSSKGSPKGQILQSALDFLSHFMHIKSHEEDKKDEQDESEPEEEKEEVALQSILHRRSGAPSPAKQVRFAASPDMESVRIVQRISSMSDDGSVEPAYCAPGKKAKKNGAKKSNDDEEEEDEYEDATFGEEEYEEIGEEEEYGYKTEEIEEFKLESAEDDDTNMVESFGGEESGMVESGKMGSGQAEKLPKESEEEEESYASWEEEEEGCHLEKLDVEGNAKEAQMTNNMIGLGKKSDNKKKPEVLNVLIIPPPAAATSKTQIPDDDIPSTSRFSRFKLTPSQMYSSDAMNVDEDEGSLYQNTEDEDEDENEIPMAQPIPPTQQIKQPEPVVSPPSSDRAEFMLNFSTQNCEFTDDFWLNASNTANNNTNEGQFYNL